MLNQEISDFEPIFNHNNFNIMSENEISDNLKSLIKIKSDYENALDKFQILLPNNIEKKESMIKELEGKYKNIETENNILFHKLNEMVNLFKRNNTLIHHDIHHNFKRNVSLLRPTRRRILKSTLKNSKINITTDDKISKIRDNPKCHAYIKRIISQKLGLTKD